MSYLRTPCGTMRPIAHPQHTTRPRQAAAGVSRWCDSSQMMAGISLEQWIWYVLIGVLFVAGAGALALRSNRRPDR